VYKTILINAKLQTGKRSKKTEMIGRNPLKRRMCAMVSSAIEEEE